MIALPAAIGGFCNCLETVSSDSAIISLERVANSMLIRSSLLSSLFLFMFTKWLLELRVLWFYFDLKMSIYIISDLSVP